MLKTERMDRVRAALRAQGLTQMIVCDPKSVWYLTGVAVEPYERLLALYLPTEGEPVLFLNRLFNVPVPPWWTVWHRSPRSWTRAGRWALTRSGPLSF